MLPAGQTVVDAARADSSWTSLHSVENLLVPDDLAEIGFGAAGSRNPII
jgi:hypothetical protein